MNVTEEELKITVPCRGVICGSSNAGKSYFITRVLKNRSRIFDQPFDQIIFCNGNTISSEKDRRYLAHLQELVPGIDILDKLPSHDELEQLEGNTLLILEDMMSTIVNSEEHMRLFTVYSSHCSISVIFTTQNYFEQGKFSKTVLRNQTFLVLFDSVSDRHATSVLSRQMFPKRKNFLNSCFEWLNLNIQKREYRYLFIDCTMATVPLGFPQIRSNIMNESHFNGMLLFEPSKK